MTNVRTGLFFLFSSDANAVKKRVPGGAGASKNVAPTPNGSGCRCPRRYGRTSAGRACRLRFGPAGASARDRRARTFGTSSPRRTGSSAGGQRSRRAPRPSADGGDRHPDRRVLDSSRRVYELPTPSSLSIDRNRGSVRSLAKRFRASSGDTVPVRAEWQVSHVRPFPPNVSLSKSFLPFGAWESRLPSIRCR